MLNELRFNTKEFVRKVVSNIDINKLQVNKLFVYNADKKKSLAYVFDNCCQACRVLIPSRCKNLSDIYLTNNKILQLICRVINKGTLTKTEIGQFYNPKRVFYPYL